MPAKAILVPLTFSIPCSFIATWIADKPSLPERTRHLVSPGFTLAERFAAGPTHTWNEMFRQFARFAGIEIVGNAVFYATLTFGMAMIAFALSKAGRQRSTSRLLP